MFNIHKPKNKGFTLIELLVVVAIIGILASVILASLNSARNKGKGASIKSNLRNMITQMELSYLDNNNYGGLNTGGTSWRPNTNCLSTSPIVNMISSVTNSGTFTRCLSTNYTNVVVGSETWSDVLQRWGVTAFIPSTTGPIEAYSASQDGVVKWDECGVSNTGVLILKDTNGNCLSGDVQMNWTQAVNACALSGGRLPTIEELKTLADAECQKRGNEPCTSDSERNPPGFLAYGYWSGTTVPSSSGSAYYVHFSSGYMSSLARSTGYVRCVR